MTPPEVVREGQWRFLTLTLSLCVWMLLAPHLGDRWLVQLLLHLFLIGSVLVTLWANPQWERIRYLLVSLWVLSLLGTVISLLPVPEAWQKLANTIEGVSALPLLAMLAAGILRHVFTRRQLNIDGIFATVAVYLLIAFLFAQIYVLLLVWDAGSFDLPVAQAERSQHLLHSDMLYFSMVTLATVGYGDVLPASEAARTLAVLEALIGQFYVAVVVAVFVGMYAARIRE